MDGSKALAAIFDCILRGAARSKCWGDAVRSSYDDRCSVHRAHYRRQHYTPTQKKAQISLMKPYLVLIWGWGSSGFLFVVRFRPPRTVPLQDMFRDEVMGFQTTSRETSTASCCKQDDHTLEVLDMYSLLTCSLFGTIFCMLFMFRSLSYLSRTSMGLRGGGAVRLRVPQE